MKIFNPKKAFPIGQCVNLLLSHFSLKTSFNSLTSGGNHDFPAVRMDYTREFEDFFNYRKVELYLFEDVTSGELKKIVEILSEKHVFNPRAKFIVTGHSFKMELRKIFLKLHVLDVLFIQSKTGYIFRFMPSTLSLVRTSRCSEDLTLSHISEISHGEVENIWKNHTLSLLYFKSFVYSECPFCDHPGIEMEIIKLLLKHFNIKATFQQANLNDKIQTWIKHDVIFGTLVIAFPLKELDSTMPYIFDEAAFFVPISFNIPRWKYILTAFPFNVWIVWFFLSILLSFVWISTRIVDRNVGYLRVFVSGFLFFLEQSERISAKLLSRRILLACTLMLSFNMNLFFKGRFTYLLDGVNHEHSGHTIEAIMENGLNIGVSTRYMADYLNSTPEVRLYIAEHMVECIGKKLSICINRAITKRDLALLFTVKKIRSRKREFADPYTGHPLLEQIQPSVTPIPVVLAFPRGHPCQSFFNEKLACLRESGVVDMISRKYEESLAPNEGTFLTEAKALDFDHIVGPVFIWTSGCLLGFLVFLNEFYHIIQ